MNDVAEHYLADKVMTASPAELTGMLYDGAAAAVRVMIRLQDDGQWAAAVAKSLKAQNIMMELRFSLDLETGGQLATDLNKLYIWVMSSLVRATTDNDVTPARDSLRVLEQLSGAWQEGCLGVLPSPPAAAVTG